MKGNDCQSSGCKVGSTRSAWGERWSWADCDLVFVHSHPHDLICALQESKFASIGLAASPTIYHGLEL